VATFGGDDGTVWKDGRFDTLGGRIYVGDDSTNVAMRSFISFSLASIPEAVKTIEAATFSVWKSQINGAPYDNLEDCIPACTITGASIMLEHLAYGNTLDAKAFDVASLETLGEIDNRFYPSERASIDVSASVADDLTKRDERNNQSQYRLRFPVDTNGNNQDDYVAFLTSDVARDGFPRLIVDYFAP
jgi:hypothetical protein